MALHFGNLMLAADYVKLLNESLPIWLDEFKDITDKRILWDLIKYRIRQVSINYSKEGT